MSASEERDLLQRVEELNAAPRDPPGPPTLRAVRDRRSGTVTVFEAADRPDIVGCWLTIDADYALEVGP